MKIVKMTEQEIAAARQMLDVALKAIGGQAAQVYLALDMKLRDAKEEPAPAFGGKTEGGISGINQDPI